MRLQSGDGRVVHLGYCFNVLPGETVAALHEQIDRFCAPLRAGLGVARMGVGLWIAHAAARELASDAHELRRFRAALDDAGLYVFTLNGFPYGGFHAPRVKEQVFLPSWAEPARLAYTLDLGRVLAGLLPDDVEEGTISTVPLGPREVDRAVAEATVREASAALIAQRIRLCIEPEPGAAIERLEALPAGTSACLDTCHAAVVGEDVDAAWRALDDAGVVVGKIQLSSALVVPSPEDDAQRAMLASFAEPRFLHQVRSTHGGAMDVPEALAAMDRSAPWRVHFHVPVHRVGFGALGTTAANIEPALRAMLARPGRLPHLEVETYTWNVLPEAERPRDDAGLVAGLVRELEWTLGVLAGLDVRPA